MIGIIITIILFCIVAYFSLNWAKDYENQKCFDYELQENCKKIDYCKKDCLDFGREYYKYECGGSFCSIEDCWCLNNNTPQQIW